MTKYYVDNEGNFLGGFDGVTIGGEYLEPNIPDGAIEVETPPQDARQKFINGTWSSLEEAIPFNEKRANAYASIEEQLDMQYWDLVNGTTTWKDHITNVKNTYPKA
jgi:hypothetical protein